MLCGWLCLAMVLFWLAMVVIDAIWWLWCYDGGYDYELECYGGSGAMLIILFFCDYGVLWGL